MKKIFKYLLIFYGLSILISNKKLQIKWSSNELVDYINHERVNKANYIHDPSQNLSQEERDNLLNLTNNISEKQSLFINIIIISDISDNFSMNDIIDKIDFYLPSNKENSIFILYIMNIRQYSFYLGRNIKEIYSESYLNKMKEKINNNLSIFENIKNIISIFNFAKTNSNNEWTPNLLLQSFKNKFGQNLSKLQSCYYDPNNQIGTNTLNKIKKYFTDFDQTKAKMFLLIIDKIKENENFDNFFKEFEALCNNELVTKNIVYALYSINDKKFQISLGSDLGVIDYKILISIKLDATQWDDLETSLISLMRDCRFYILGQKLGWQTKMLSDFLKEETNAIEQLYFYLYKYKDSSIDIYTKKYFNSILNDLSDSDLNLFVIALEHYDKTKYQNLEIFHNEFIQYFKPININNVNNLVYVYIIENDKEIYLKIGNNHKKIFTNEIQNNLINNVKNQFDNKINGDIIIKYILKYFRFYKIINIEKFNPKTFSLYYNDIYDSIPLYAFYDPYKKIDESYSKHYNFIKYLDDINKYYFNTFIIILNEINTTLYNSSESCDNFAKELFDNFSLPKNPTSQRIEYKLLVIYFEQFNRFSFYYGEKYEKLLNENKIKNIQDKILDNQLNLTQKIHIILKYLRYHLFMEERNWSGESLGEYVNDFYENSTSLFLAPDEPPYFLDSYKNLNLKSYVNEIDKELNIHIYAFTVQNNQSFFGVMKSLVKFLRLPPKIKSDDCIFIVYMPQIKEYEFEIGDNVEDLIDLVDINLFAYNIKKADLKNEYLDMKILLQNTKNKLYKGKINEWTPKKINDFFLKYYDKKDSFIYKENYIFDNNVYLNKTYEERTYYNYLDKYKRNNKTNIFLFILEKIQATSNINTINDFAKELFKTMTFTDIDKKNVLLIIYSISDNLIGMFPGSNTENIFSFNYINEIIAKTTRNLEDNYHQILVNLFIEIEEAFKIPLFWTGDNIKNYVLSNYGHPKYLIFDPHKNLNKNEYLQINKYLKDLEDKSTNNYIIITSSKSKLTMKNYIGDIAKNFPIEKKNKNTLTVFLVLVTENGMSYSFQIFNDKFKKLASKDIDKLSSESLRYFRDYNFLSGFNNTLFTIGKLYGKKKSNLLIYKSMAFGFGFIAIVLLIFILVTRRIRRKRRNDSIHLLSTRGSFQHKRSKYNLKDLN